MKHHGIAATSLLVLAAWSALAIEPAPIIVTAETPKGTSAPVLSMHDVIARIGNQPVTVAGWRALRADPAGLELWIMIDDGTDTRVGVQFGDIREFIRQQPATTKVGIGYLQNGSVLTMQKPTTDHEAAAKAIRLPLGLPGISASPYIALADFLHKREKGPSQAREILLISSGIDPYYGPGPQNPYLQDAIHDAQKVGIPVYSIYYSTSGHLGHSYWQIEWGQNDLSELSEETGGEFYWQGDRNPVAFKPFLEDLNRRLAEQYVMLLDTSGARTGFERLRLHTESLHFSLVGPSQIYIR